MRRLLILLFALTFTLSPYAQSNKQRKKEKTTAVSKKKKNNKSRKKKTKSIGGLKNERSKVQKEIKNQKKRLVVNKADVKKRLANLMVINQDIEVGKRKMDSIRGDINRIDGNIKLLNVQLKTLEGQLKVRKDNYIKSMRYVAKHRSIQDQLMFIFSADNFTQVYRRLRFVRDYAAFQKAQGEALKKKQTEVDEKRRQLEKKKKEKNRLLAEEETAKQKLEAKQKEQNSMVATLKNKQRTIQNIITQQERRSAQLDAEIDRLIAEEIAKQRAKAAEEARKKAAAEAARKKAADLARKKAAAEAAAKRNAERIAAAKKAEAKARADAQKASEAQKSAAEHRLKVAEAERAAAERKAAADAKRMKHAVDAAKKAKTEYATIPEVDRNIDGSFRQNKGRLPMPMSGSCRIINHYGQYNVEGLRNVRLDNKGITIRGTGGSRARAIYPGEVSAVFSFGDTMVVMVRHGSYISVYCNLSMVSVKKGQKVASGQAIGSAADNVLQFQLRHEKAKLNPEAWIR